MPERINASQVLVAVGGVVLFVSLFLNWYESSFDGQSGLTAWAVFELLDIVLAGLAVVAVATVIPMRGERGPATLVASRWLPWIGIAALVLVVVTLLNDPPAARGRSLEIGAWIGLAGALMLTAGGLLSVARVSLVVSLRPVGDEDPEGTEPLRNEPEATEPLRDEPEATEPLEEDPGATEPPEDEQT